MSLHDEIRRIATEKFVHPAKQRGEREFSISVKALMRAAEAEGISTAQRTPAFCTAIQTREFYDAGGVDVRRVEGPASKKSTTVVVWYRFRDVVPSAAVESSNGGMAGEDPLLEIAGILKGAIREGAAAFLRELRRDEAPTIGADVRKSA